MVKKVYYDSLRDIFFRHPGRRFGLREISKMARLSHPSVIEYLRVLAKEGIVVKGQGYHAANSETFRREKRLRTIHLLYQTGLVEFLADQTLPCAIILFGSAAKGEDGEGSDIDIFIESPEKSLHLQKHERLLGRKINLTFGIIKKLQRNFLNSILNGVILYGGINL